jgi:hypothetical protein
MNVKRTCLSLALTLMAPAAAMAASGNLVGYGYAQIYQSNSTVTLLNVTIPSGFRGGELKAIKCIFPSSDGGAEVKIKITYDAGTGHEQDLSFTVDPTFFQQESNGSGQFLSDWVPLRQGAANYPVLFGSTLLVQLNNTNLGTATINCWATWGTLYQIE